MLYLALGIIIGLLVTIARRGQHPGVPIKSNMYLSGENERQLSINGRECRYLFLCLKLGESLLDHVGEDNPGQREEFKTYFAMMVSSFINQLRLQGYQERDDSVSINETYTLSFIPIDWATIHLMVSKSTGVYDDEFEMTADQKRIEKGIQDVLTTLNINFGPVGSRKGA